MPTQIKIEPLSIAYLLWRPVKIDVAESGLVLVSAILCFFIVEFSASEMELASWFIFIPCDKKYVI